MSQVAVESGRAPGGGGGSSDGKAEGDGMNELYKVNQIYYRMMPTLSLVSKRTLLVNQAQSPSYIGTGSSVIFNFNTGEYYICPTTSYLYIQCGFKDAAAAWGTTKALIAQGNILSIIEEVIFTTASGTEVERQINKGMHHAITSRYEHTQEYLDTNGQIQGFPYGPYFRNHDGVAPVQTTTLASRTDYSAGAMFPALGGPDGVSLPRSGSAAKAEFGVGATNLNVYSTQVTAASGVPDPAGTGFTQLDLPAFVVPLDQILGLFKPYQNCLFPAGALSGGRLEIRFKRAAEAFQFVGSKSETKDVGDTKLAAFIAAADASFQISRTYLVLDAFQLQDNVLKRLNQTAAGADGLSMLFDTYDHVTTPFSGTGSVEAQVSQARSRVVKSLNVVRDNSLITNPYVNSFASEAAMRRVAAKVGPGVVNPSGAGSVPIPITGSDTLIGGGITQTWAITVGADYKTVNTGVALQYVPFIKQPYLPNDPFIATWGDPTVRSFQTQLGALFFPQQPLTTLVEYYQNALYMFGKGVPDKDNTCSVTFEDFCGAMGYNLNGLEAVTNLPPGVAGANTNPTIGSTGATLATQNRWVGPYGLAVYGALMEKSQALQLSGLPISNARLLRHKFDFAYASTSGQRTIHTFTQFTRVLKQYLGGRVVVRE